MLHRALKITAYILPCRPILPCVAASHSHSSSGVEGLVVTLVYEKGHLPLFVVIIPVQASAQGQVHPPFIDPDYSVVLPPCVR